MFVPPELMAMWPMSEGPPMDGPALAIDRLRSLYFKSIQSEKADPELDRRLVETVLEHARSIIAHPAHPTVTERVPFELEPYGELALEESLEEDPELSDPKKVLVERSTARPFHCSLILDTSSSMSGEKHLLASIAVAVFLLSVEASGTALIRFSTKADSVKKPGDRKSPERTVLEFLQAIPRGFTNIGAGLRLALEQQPLWEGDKKRIGLIATDGRATEGEDPFEVAKLFDYLLVLHLHGPGSSLESSKRLASVGHGACLEVERMEELPRRMYEALRTISRR